MLFSPDRLVAITHYGKRSMLHFRGWRHFGTRPEVKPLGGKNIIDLISAEQQTGYPVIGSSKKEYTAQRSVS